MRPPIEGESLAGEVGGMVGTKEDDAVAYLLGGVGPVHGQNGVQVRCQMLDDWVSCPDSVGPSAARQARHTTSAPDP